MGTTTELLTTLADPDAPGRAQAVAAVRALLASAAVDARAPSAKVRAHALDWTAQVCAAGPSAVHSVLPELLALVRESPATRAETDLSPLLALFFPTAAPEEPSAAQAAVAMTLAQNRLIHGHRANGKALLGRHGLPTRPRPLRAYAARGPAPYAELVPAMRAEEPPDQVLRDLLAREVSPPEELRRLDVVQCASDELLARLSMCAALEQLSIKSSTVSAHGLAALASLGSLRVLILEDLALDRDGALAVARVASLSHLNLVDVDLGDDVLGALARARPSLTVHVTPAEHSQG